MRRVRTYAAYVGGLAWTPEDRSYLGDAEFDDLMRRDKAELKRMMAQGRTIIDIGPDFEGRASGQPNRPSPFYNTERQLIAEANFGGYAKDFERTGRVTGGNRTLGELC